MSLRDTLTNEPLLEKFNNPFDLVNYAISCARERVFAGEGEDNPHISSDVLEELVEEAPLLTSVLEVDLEINVQEAE